jgi:hypothetical protein
MNKPDGTTQHTECTAAGACATDVNKPDGTTQHTECTAAGACATDVNKPDGTNTHSACTATNTCTTDVNKPDGSTSHQECTAVGACTTDFNKPDGTTHHTQCASGACTTDVNKQEYVNADGSKVKVEVDPASGASKVTKSRADGSIHEIYTKYTDGSEMIESFKEDGAKEETIEFSKPDPQTGDRNIIYNGKRGSGQAVEKTDTATNSTTI